jgi:hypothetical protein
MKKLINGLVNVSLVIVALFSLVGIGLLVIPGALEEAFLFVEKVVLLWPEQDDVDFASVLDVVIAIIILDEADFELFMEAEQSSSAIISTVSRDLSAQAPVNTPQVDTPIPPATPFPTPGVIAPTPTATAPTVAPTFTAVPNLTGLAALVYAEPELDIYAWTGKYVLPLLKDDRVEWDKKLKVTDLGKYGEDHVDDHEGEAHIIWTFWEETGYVKSIVLKYVKVDKNLSSVAARWCVLKEVYAHYMVAVWWLNNPSYIIVRRDNKGTIVSFIDGMAYNCLAKYNISGDPDYLVHWNGTQMPTCAHLRAVQQLYTDGKVLGTGVEPLLAQHCGQQP